MKQDKGLRKARRGGTASSVSDSLRIKETKREEIWKEKK